MRIQSYKLLLVIGCTLAFGLSKQVLALTTPSFDNNVQPIGISDSACLFLAYNETSSLEAELNFNFPFSGGVPSAGGNAWVNGAITTSGRRDITANDLLQQCPTFDAVNVISQNGADASSYANEDYIGITFSGIPGGTQAYTYTVAIEGQSNFTTVLNFRTLNFPPIADPGTNQQVPGTSIVTLDGSGSFDPDPEDSLTYLWTQSSGTVVTLSNHESAIPTFVAPNPPSNSEVLVFSLVVSDGIQSSDPETVSITVDPFTNTPPTADAGDDQIMNALNTGTLNGRGSEDIDVWQPLTYNWQQTAGTPVSLSSNSDDRVFFIAPKLMPGAADELLTFTLVVNDGFEDSQLDSVDVTVVAPPVVQSLANALIFNQFVDPADLILNYGDLLFTADGNQVYVIVDSEGINGRVLVADVSRDSSRNVTGFGAFTELFVADNIDTGLAYAPGSDTLFYHQSNLGIGQRRATGEQEQFVIQNYDDGYGGLAFVPAQYSHANQLLKADYNNNQLWLHAVSDDGDGTFTLAPASLVSNVVAEALGDVEYITTGTFANHLIIADYTELLPLGTAPSVFLIAVDETTGLPANDPTMVPFAGGVNDAWGLSFDPFSGNLWLIQFDSYVLTQFKFDEIIFANPFE